MWPPRPCFFCKKPIVVPFARTPTWVYHGYHAIDYDKKEIRCVYYRPNRKFLCIDCFRRKWVNVRPKYRKKPVRKVWHMASENNPNITFCGLSGTAERFSMIHGKMTTKRFIRQSWDERINCHKCLAVKRYRIHLENLRKRDEELKCQNKISASS